MKTNIYMPDKIVVGYNERRDTESGYLAYVTSYDKNGKLRKEKSWQNWRNKNIEPGLFDNVPTEGFSLGNSVGGYGYGWNMRKEYCRVQDPRGFDIEISTGNLLYILRYVASMPGKRLIGKMVYCWDGADLLLVPEDSDEYKEISKFNNIIKSKQTIKAKDLVVGSVYMYNGDKKMVYLGKAEHYKSLWEYESIISNDGEVHKGETESGYFSENEVYKVRRINKKLSDRFVFYPYTEEEDISEYKFYDYNYLKVASISGKLTGVTDDTVSQERLNRMIEYLNMRSDTSPLDRYEYVPYTYGQFEQLIKTTSNMYSHGSFVTKVKIKQGNDGEGETEALLTLAIRGSKGQSYNVTADSILTTGYTLSDNTEIVNCAMELFGGDLKITKYGLRKHAVTENGYTIRELFDIAKPGYYNKILKNGRVSETSNYMSQ